MASLSTATRSDPRTATSDIGQVAAALTPFPPSGAAHELSDQEWDRFLAAGTLAHHEQSAAYGRGREAFGFGLERVVVREAGRIVGGAQVIIRPTPVGRVAIVRRGPLAEHDDPAVHAAVVSQLESAARERGWACLRVETFQPQERARRALRHAVYQPRASWQVQSRTAVMPLEQSDLGLLAAMHQKGRYNVNRAARRGVVVRTGDGKSVQTFHDLHAETAAYHGFPVFPVEYFRYLWELFGRVGQVQHFVAYHDDQPVAVIFSSIVGDHMYYVWGGIDRGEASRRLMANYLLHYEAMRWAREHRCRRYDLAGVARSRTSGPTQFKTRIASEITPWPEPMVKYFGALRECRRFAVDLAWNVKPLRRLVRHAGHRLGLSPVMPW